MGSIKTLVKQLFCKHEFERKALHGFMVQDGWLSTPVVLECKKCGEIVNLK